MANWITIITNILIYGGIILGVILVIAGALFLWYLFTHYILKRRYTKEKDNGRSNTEHPDYGTNGGPKGTGGGFGANPNVSERGILQEISNAISGEYESEPIQHSTKLNADNYITPTEARPRSLKLFSKK